MRLLVLGGHGMAGHIITRYFQKKDDVEVYYTSRKEGDKEGIYLDARDYVRLLEVLDLVQPDIIINALGILNTQATTQKMSAIQVNSLLPHILAEAANLYKAKLIHISTDCVFSGDLGNYSESDPTDGISDYAKSKALGEITRDNHLTIRTSIIGPELKDDGIGLFQWFMKQTGVIKGFTNVFWNGVTTLELAKAIDSMIKTDVTGLYHLGSDEKISKYQLLKCIQKTFNKWDVVILPDNEMRLDRTIVTTRKDFKYDPPPYPDMLAELKEFIISST